MLLELSIGVCFPGLARMRPFGAMRLIGPESSIRSLLGTGFQSALPHLEHFRRLVLADKPHDAQFQFILELSFWGLFLAQLLPSCNLA